MRGAEHGIRRECPIRVPQKHCSDCVVPHESVARFVRRVHSLHAEWDKIRNCSRLPRHSRRQREWDDGETVSAQCGAHPPFHSTPTCFVHDEAGTFPTHVPRLHDNAFVFLSCTSPHHFFSKKKNPICYVPHIRKGFRTKNENKETDVS